MRTRLLWRAVMIGALAMGTLGACGDDDDDETASPTGAGSSTTAAAGGDSDANELNIEMVDYGYKVTGSLKAGLATVTSTNTGKEWHMAGFGKLKEGATVEDLTKALQAGGEGGGEGGGEEEDPTAKFIEEELGAPGHILQPGETQSLTVDVLKPGNYVMLCFLPTEGEGTPHFAKGMVNSFEVAEEKSAAAAPTEDAAITLGDETDPEGVPADLKGGERTFKITSSGDKTKDFIVGQVKPGKKFEDFDTYFETEFEKEGGPAKGVAANAPGTILGSTFEVKPGQTIWMTVDLPPGKTYFVSSINTEGSDETVDKVVEVTVT